MLRPLTLGMIFCLAGSSARAAQGDPVSIRLNAKASISVESFWGVQVKFDDASREISVNKAPNWSHVGHADWLPDTSTAKDNAATGSVFVTADTNDTKLTEHAARVESAKSRTHLHVDGVTLLTLHSKDSNASQSPVPPGATGRLDVLLIPIAHTKPKKWLQALNPRIVIPYSLAGEQVDRDQLLEFAERVGISSEQCRVVPSNVVPVSHAAERGQASEQPTRLIAMKNSAMKLPAKLESLLVAKEAESEKTARVFESMSANQLNWKPPNGTHTPRWNTEHMMGRELLFFSQMFHQQNDEIPVIDRNPKQMPKDYKADHPEWTGREEARRIRRVAKFTRDYAYLISDLPMDKKAPGSNWTPERLLKQMDFHYGDHTGKTKLKFDLPEWPKD